ncbi:MAG: ATP-binding protein [Chitinophagaceae bacterium]
MNDVTEDWGAMNARYLSAYLEWLRLKMVRQALSYASGSDAADMTRNETETEKAAEVIAALEQSRPGPALAILKRRFLLSDFEQHILFLCAAMELDTRIPSLCSKAQDDLNKPFPTFALAMSLFGDAAWDALSAQRPLRYWRLIEVSRTHGQPLIGSLIKGDERIIDFIRGLNYLDERIAKLSSPFDVTGNDAALPASQKEIADRIGHNLNQSESRPSGIVQLTGADPVSKQLVAQHVALGRKFELINLPLESLSQQSMELEELARLWQRESHLLSIAGFIDISKAELFSKGDGHHHTNNFPLQRFLSLSQRVFFVATQEVRAELLPGSFVMDIKKPTPEEQKIAWDDQLGATANGSAALLAGQFNFNVSTITEITAKIRKDHSPDDDLHKLLWQHCVEQSSVELDLLVQKLELKSSWDDIVLPEIPRQQLIQIANQVRMRSCVYDTWGFRKKMNRGLGINALFVGESGTGKTMAAEVLANELKLQLYRIDLSGVISKYIGETEKNLKRVFDAAENGGAILFFDEADALFGKRTDVKDSHDRYANIEVNYLLQRMESFSGLAILATNKKSAIDDAFMRRFRVIIQFPFPGMQERKAIVEKMFPAEVPIAYLDYDRLASLNLTGGSYYNIAINAAFKAAENGSAITMPILLSAAKAELQKIERPVKEADFIWHE